MREDIIGANRTASAEFPVSPLFFGKISIGNVFEEETLRHIMLKNHMSNQSAFEGHGSHYRRAGEKFFGIRWDSVDMFAGDYGGDCMLYRVSLTLKTDGEDKQQALMHIISALNDKYGPYDVTGLNMKSDGLTDEISWRKKGSKKMVSVLVKKRRRNVEESPGRPGFADTKMDIESIEMDYVHYDAYRAALSPEYTEL